jgi:hypothetical protein
LQGSELGWCFFVCLGFPTAWGVQDANVAAAVSKLAIVSLVMVFKDIIPGYRIRPLDAEEKSASVSSEVKHVRAFEQCLLGNYQSFLQHLHKRIRGIYRTWFKRFGYKVCLTLALPAKKLQ